MENNRRDFLKKGALLGLTSLGMTLIGKEKLNSIEELINQLPGDGKFTLPALPYAYDALEPFIDKETMQIHHDKHHQAYVDNLNKALLTEKLLAGFTLEQILAGIGPGSAAALRNNAGGHYNHSLFWTLMKPNPQGAENKPQGKLAEAIARDFKSFDEFKKAFSEKSVKIFGSGWCWLIVQNGTLKIVTTANQDNPLMGDAADKGKPVLALDVWEHAYYLKYQNKRADYIAGWWNTVNWERANALFAAS